MHERRRSARVRSYLGGRISYGNGCCVTECLLRNYSAGGALLDLSSTEAMPSDFALQVAAKDAEVQAHMVWRTEQRMGIAFSAPGAVVLPFALARRLRALEETNEALRQRLGEGGESA
jgi:hypothetical protein